MPQHVGHCVRATAPVRRPPITEAKRPLVDVLAPWLLPALGPAADALRGATVRADAKAASHLDADAFTIGRDVVVHPRYADPAEPDTDRLLAHELVHIVQQYRARTATTSPIVDPDAAAEQEADELASRPHALSRALRDDSVRETATCVQRQRIGTRLTHPPGSRSPFKRLQCEFDGREFVLRDGATELMRVPAASGRPVAVRPADASACGSSTSESYLNNPRYVGVREYGPIPEGRFDFRATSMVTFTALEQASFTLGGSFTDAAGHPMHGGDWGAGRVPLAPVRVAPGPPGCGRTAARSGFYLHGGSLAGSSGCIDIGNNGIASLVPLLAGYTKAIPITVKYRHPAPSVGVFERVLGGATYPGQGSPTAADRLRGVWEQLVH